MRTRLLIGAVSAAAVCVTSVAAAGGLSGGASSNGAFVVADGAESQSAAALPSFSSCMGFLAYAKSNALDLVGPYGLGGIALPYTDAAPPEAAAEDSGGVPAPSNDFSGTNVQEEGVDEPDIVKTDGDVVYAVAQGKLNAVDVSGPLPVLLGSLPLGEGVGHQLLLAGDRLLVTSTTGFFFEPLPAMEGDVMPPNGTPSTLLTEVDVSDPAAMRVVRTLTLEANYVNARLVGSVARLVVSSTPTNLPFVYPETGKRADLAAAKRRNRAVIRASKLDNWIPVYTVHEELTGRTTTRPLLGCPDVRHPAEFSGLGMLSVLTIDLTQGIEPVDTDAVMASGDTVYASTQGLYVATQQWVDPIPLDDPSASLPAVTTAIHKFDISSPSQTEYRGSGTVTGYLLNQWSLSERDGFLRVVSTDAPSWWGGEESETESMVTVMADEGGRLATVGRLGGLGLASASTPCVSSAISGTSSPSARSTRCTSLTSRTRRIPRCVESCISPATPPISIPSGTGYSSGWGRTRPLTAVCSVRRPPSSTSRAPTTPCCSTSCSWARGGRRSSSTTMPSFTGPRRASQCCRSSAGTSTRPGPPTIRPVPSASSSAGPESSSSGRSSTRRPLRSIRRTRAMRRRFAAVS